MACLNCLEIDGHIFGLYSIVGFRDIESSPIDGCWAGIVYIRSKIDYSTSFPNNIRVQECNETEYIPDRYKNKGLDDTVLVADDLKNKIFKSYLNKKTLLLEIIEISISNPDEGLTRTYKAIQAILPYSSPLTSKKILRAKISN